MTFQIDTIFSFAIGASLGAAAGVRLRKEASIIFNYYFIYSVLFIGLVLVPVSEFLLWEYTDWQFMYTYKHSELAGYVPGLFALGAVLGNIIGFLLCASLVKHSAEDVAHAIWSTAYAIIFAILGFAYDRFLYTGTLDQWRAGVKLPLMDFFSSQIFYILAVVLTVGISPVFYAVITWPAGPTMTAERKRTILHETVGPYVVATIIMAAGYVILLQSTTWLPIDSGVDRLIGLLVCEVIGCGYLVVLPMRLIPLKDLK